MNTPRLAPPLVRSTLLVDPPWDSGIAAGPSGLPDDGAADPARRWLREECEALFKQIVGMTTEGGDTAVSMHLSWKGGVLWARNRPKVAQLVRKGKVVITRRTADNRGAQGSTTQLDEASLRLEVAKLEQRLKQTGPQNHIWPGPQQYANAPLWSDKTFAMTVEAVSQAAEAGVEPVKAAGLLAAGGVGTRVETWAVFNTLGVAAYAVGTMGAYSETVRIPDGTGSGWAGLSHTDWTTLNVAQLSARALRKCVESAKPRAIEPGRYTAVLEPETVSGFMGFIVGALGREAAEGGGGPFHDPKSPTRTKIGQQILDERITISTDPADPLAPYFPFTQEGYAYRPVTWIERGVLKALSYDQYYARRAHQRGVLESDVPLFNPDAFRMSGGETSIEEMIATTPRGFLVTRPGNMERVDPQRLILQTVTRDGLWLIENGKIKYPVKNMRVLESPLYIGTRVEQLGRPERTLGWMWADERAELQPSHAFGRLPVVAPPMKVRDFNFAAMTDAV